MICHHPPQNDTARLLYIVWFTHNYFDLCCTLTTLTHPKFAAYYTTDVILMNIIRKERDNTWPIVMFSCMAIVKHAQVEIILLALLYYCTYKESFHLRTAADEPMQGVRWVRAAVASMTMQVSFTSTCIDYINSTLYIST